MSKSIFQYVEPLQYYVLATFCIAMLLVNKKKQNNKILLAILSVCLLTEITSDIILYNDGNLALLLSLSFFIHQSLWMLLLFKVIGYMNSFAKFIITYLLFAIVNFTWLEGPKNFNYNTFIIGSLVYLVVFIISSFKKLNAEKFAFFISHDFLLVCAPVLFFFGITFIFGFKSAALSETKVFWNMTLYQLIGSIGNIFYYSLVNIYIFREKKLKHAE